MNNFHFVVSKGRSITTGLVILGTSPDVDETHLGVSFFEGTFLDGFNWKPTGTPLPFWRFHPFQLLKHIFLVFPLWVFQGALSLDLCPYFSSAFLLAGAIGGEGELDRPF